MLSDASTEDDHEWMPRLLNVVTPTIEAVVPPLQTRHCPEATLPPGPTLDNLSIYEAPKRTAPRPSQRLPNSRSRSTAPARIGRYHKGMDRFPKLPHQSAGGGIECCGYIVPEAHAPA